MKMKKANKTIKVNFTSIRRTIMHNVETRDEFKTCSTVLKKRRYISKNCSLSFGYKKIIHPNV
ncbi:hypothetical protein TSAR_001985 [Trichomalopsis sarcophagae]|uniref:Uncharacterized protein n=1 Tax=Trichomalopsis sarcophagae TaxID=543379 RepID=A0A232ELA0_9HYME|nr:hypothetical protein TSAR_001985 [Trichomalopsis sarcophagae]